MVEIRSLTTMQMIFNLMVEIRSLTTMHMILMVGYLMVEYLIFFTSQYGSLITMRMILIPIIGFTD